MILRFFAAALLVYAFGFLGFAVSLPKPLAGEPTDAVIVLTGGPGRIARGLSVVQGDAEADLVHYPDDAFDYAILGQTIQMVDRPAEVIDALLRVGRSAFISFPNFAHWRMRVALGLGGRMPVTPALPESWHATGNIRNLTVVDFKELVSDRGARIERAWYFGKGREIGEFGANLRAEFALFLIGRG